MKLEAINTALAATYGDGDDDAEPTGPTMEMFACLMDAQPWTEITRDGKDKPRVATEKEVALYAAQLATRAGLPAFNDYSLAGVWDGRNSDIRGVTFGTMTRPADWTMREVLDFDTLTVRHERVRREAEYEEGSYSVPLPGRNKRETVTMEILDDAGEVTSTSTMPTDKKRCIVWDRSAVRKAAGPVEKAKALPRKSARAKISASQHRPEPAAVEQGAPPPPLSSACEAVPETANDTAPSLPDAMEAAGGMIGELIAGLVARIEVLESRLATTENKPEAESGDITADSANDRHNARTRIMRARDCPARLRMIRRYLAMRKERDMARMLQEGFQTLRDNDQRRAINAERKRRRAVTRAMEMRRQLRTSYRVQINAAKGISAANEQIRQLETRASHAEQRAEAAEFAVTDLRHQMELVEKARSEDWAHWQPKLDKKQARIIELENRLIEIQSGGRVKMSLAYGKPAVSFAPKVQ